MNYLQFFQLQDGIIDVKKSSVLNCLPLCNLGFQLDPNLSRSELTNALLYQTQHYNGYTVEVVDYWTVEDMLKKLHLEDELAIKLSPLGRILHNCLTADKTYINENISLMQNGPIKQFTRLLYPHCLLNNNNNNKNHTQLSTNNFVGLLNGSTKNIKNTYLRIPKQQAIFIHQTRRLKRTITNVFLVIAPYRESTIDPLVSNPNEKVTLDEESIIVVDKHPYQTVQQAYSATFVFTDENATSTWVMQNTIDRCINYTPALNLTAKSYREIAVIKLGYIPDNADTPRLLHDLSTRSQYFLFDNFIFNPQKWIHQTFSYDSSTEDTKTEEIETEEEETDEEKEAEKEDDTIVDDQEETSST